MLFVWFGFLFSWVWFGFFGCLVGGFLGCALVFFFLLADMLTWSSSLPDALILWLLHFLGENVDLAVKDNTCCCRAV